ncbi:hypothetical protein HC931_15115 [Candidatus Gracilibacteria bacterium]|nr:hypothetical protein [Candidatus Gracilibacteria bacterium]NJM90105.1 hypothetical protein [Hydrococcus sp. RU_2_2]NJP20241.1 hypothetical protein [Hydrococcus sp. CRU_1_1]NJQ97133.1 hypothetical protein [Hydrococcus sp. CSU_1_8]
MYNVYPLFKTNRALRVCEPTSDDGYGWQLVPLNDAEKVRLLELEAIVDRGLQTFYEVGQVLIEIRDRKLYRQTHKTFEAYCKENWSIAKRTAYQLISATKVVENLCAMAHKILTNERQVRPLTKLPAAQQLEIWQKAVEISPDGNPTAKIVERLVEEQEATNQNKKPSSEIEQLRQENDRLKEELKKQKLEREQRTALVATELERLREENRQLKAELRQRDKDWEIRLAVEREKIRLEIEAK